MQHMFYILERIYRLTRIPTRYVEGKSSICLFCRGFGSRHDPLQQDAVLRQRLIEKATDGDTIPVLEFEDDTLLYAAFRDNRNCYCIMGPVAIMPLEDTYLQQYAGTHNVEIDGFEIPQGTMAALCTGIALACFSTTGNPVTETEIASKTSYSDQYFQDAAMQKQNACQAYTLDNSEQEISRFSYADEMDFMQAVREGKPEDILARTDVANLERVGKQAEKPFKHYEYLCCATISVSTRAAMQGGMDSITAYAMSDIFKQTLEKCTSIQDIMKLQRDTMLGFAEQVKQTKNQRNSNSYIEKCKTYIANNLNRSFTLEDIAAEIGINKSYLSRRFSQTEGVGIQKYTQNKRVEAAANLLKFSDESISAIASYLCFPSQSYLGQVFKKHYGVTPQKYREKEKLIEIKL